MTRLRGVKTLLDDMAVALRVEGPDPLQEHELLRKSKRQKRRGQFGRLSPLISLTIPNPDTELAWYKGLLPWLWDFKPKTRGKMFLIAAAWVPIGFWDRWEWMRPSKRVVAGKADNRLYSPIDTTDPDVYRLWKTALDVPLQQVAVFAITNVYARDKLIRLVMNVRQAGPGQRAALVDEIFRSTLPRPEQLRPKNLSKRAPRYGKGKWKRGARALTLRRP